MKVSLVLSFQRKNFFFEKKKQKTFNHKNRPNHPSVADTSAANKEGRIAPEL
jgi:hypothetical protein